MILQVPVVYLARDLMFLIWANSLQGPLEGMGTENQDFWGPEMATSEVCRWFRFAQLAKGKKSRP